MRIDCASHSGTDTRGAIRAGPTSMPPTAEPRAADCRAENPCALIRIASADRGAPYIDFMIAAGIIASFAY